MRDHIEEEAEYIEYLVDIPTEKEIKEIVSMLGIKAEDLVRKKEKLFKENFEGKNISDEEWIGILHRHPILIERPIFVKNGKAIIGRPVERVLDII